MIGKKTNEIAVIARGMAGGGAEIGEKANENASFQFSVSTPTASGCASVQPKNGEKVKHLSPALVPTTAWRGEGGDRAQGFCERVEDGSAAGWSGVAAAGTAALREGKEAAGKDGSKMPLKGARDNAL